MVEHDTWERKEDLGNVREALEEFERRMNTEVRRQEKLDMAEEKDFRRGELPGKFTARILYGWNNGKFEKEYLKKLECQDCKKWTLFIFLSHFYFFPWIYFLFFYFLNS